MGAVLHPDIEGMSHQNQHSVQTTNMKARAHEYGWATNLGFNVGMYAALYCAGGVTAARARSIKDDIMQCMAELAIDIEPPAISKKFITLDTLVDASRRYKIFLGRVASAVEKRSDARAADLFRLMATFVTFSLLGGDLPPEILSEMKEQIERIRLPKAEALSFVERLSAGGGNRDYAGEFLLWTLTHCDYLATFSGSQPSSANEIIAIRPGFFGISLNVNALIRKLVQYLKRRKIRPQS